VSVSGPWRNDRADGSIARVIPDMPRAPFILGLLVAAVLVLAPACGGDGPGPATDASVDGAGGADGGPAELCAATGGTLGSQLCCGGVTDFPDTCAVGNCGCSPSASHEVQVCLCPEPRCYAPGKGCKDP
jgi:hypothetical protein